MNDSGQRYIPSLRTVRHAAESLPPADTWRAETFSVPLKDERLIEFRKVKIKSKQGTQLAWIYEGKVRVT